MVTPKKMPIEETQRKWERKQSMALQKPERNNAREEKKEKITTKTTRKKQLEKCQQ